MPLQYIFAATTAVSWAIDSFIDKTIVKSSELSPLTILSVKLCIMGLIGLSLLPLTMKHILALPGERIKPFATLVTFGTLALISGQMFLLLAYSITERPTLVTTIAYCSPLISMVLFAIFMNEKITASSIAGACFVFVGIALMTL